MSKVLNISIVIVLLVAGTALADWFPGEGHKMHFPQLPDLQPTGMDVLANWPYDASAQTGKILADDWQCSQDGPVADIHIWGSWEWDRLPQPMP